MVKLNKIYTRTGDDGTTALGTGRSRREIRSARRGLWHGRRDQRDHRARAACIPARPTPALDAMLARIQNDLFDLGADLCFPEEMKKGEAALQGERCADRAPRSRDRRDECVLDPLRSFVLPGGTPAASYLHLARTVCRRAERLVVALAPRARTSRSATQAVALYQPAVGLPVRRGSLRQRQGRFRCVVGARSRTAESRGARACSSPFTTPTLSRRSAIHM